MMIFEEVINLLRDAPPFQFLDDSTLRWLASNASTEFYPKGASILKQDGPPSNCFRVIKKGAVKVFIKPDTGEEVLIDYRSEGDSFGFLSMIGGDKSRANVVAIEDTIVYLFSKD